MFPYRYELELGALQFDLRGTNFSRRCGVVSWSMVRTCTEMSGLPVFAAGGAMVMCRPKLCVAGPGLGAAGMAMFMSGGSSLTPRHLAHVAAEVKTFVPAAHLEM